MFNENIEIYIPQRKPMIMVDFLTEANETMAKSISHVKAENILAEDGRCTEALILENIAQTAAAHAGYLARKANRPVDVGYIVAIKDAIFFTLPVVECQLQTKLNISNQIGDFTVMEAKTEFENQLVCQCEMRIYVKS